jgi:phenylacetate-coenzyme A ligase PaaK-like adenylate-forming protein
MPAIPIRFPDVVSLTLPVEDAVGAVRLFLSVPGALRRRMSPERASEIVRARLERRPDDFLALIRDRVYARPTSPYRALLANAGCEADDLEGLVRSEGLEGALHALYRQGVYLTLDELKGRRAIVRGSAIIEAGPHRLGKPGRGASIPGATSGSSGRRTPVAVDLESTWRNRPNMALALHAHGLTRWELGFWRVPGASALSSLISYTQHGLRPARWFSQIDPRGAGVHPRYHLSARVTRWASLLAGVPLPLPEHVPFDDPSPILDWIAAVMGSNRVPNLMTYPSSAVRLAQAARAAGMDIAGAAVTVTGEPITHARAETIRSAGVTLMTSYAATESGRIGYGCLAPHEVDDTHLFQDLHAVIQPGPCQATEDVPSDALLLTSLRPKSRLLLLNTSLGDRATMAQRACACALGNVGWTTHLHGISAYAKVTAGGMTMFDSDLVRVLEDILPARFGGGPAQYQLVEDETDEGQPRLLLAVDPSIGPVDEAALIAAFLDGISGGSSGVEHVMELQWRSARLVRVVRERPQPSASGKIRHLIRDRLPSGLAAAV